MTSLEGATAIVLGAASGIGRGTARAMARHGARVVLGDVDGPGAAAAASEIRAAGGEAVGLAADVTTAEAFDRLRDTALDRYGRVDVVMNNVGVLTRGLPEHIPLEEWQRILDTNLLSLVRSNAVFLPLLIEQGAGHLVNTASFAGLFSYSFDRLPYAASKAAIVQISEGLRPLGVQVTLLCPGPVATNIGASIRSFGPETATRGPGPQFGVKDPDQVGDLVAGAVLDNRFFVPTDDQVVEVLRSRAADWDGYLAGQQQAMDQ
jgi:NAD(P)-dependent dehydrogenase (short-subunit alcohol dehydrogenase family)